MRGREADQAVEVLGWRVVALGAASKEPPGPVESALARAFAD